MNNKVNRLTNKKIWLAPLAGLTDQAFRQICKKNGADVLMTEMVSADGLVYDFPGSFQYARFSPDEKPLGVQIFGSKPLLMAKSVNLLLNRLEKNNSSGMPDFIDINMGCPVKKVVKKGAGAALLQNLPLAVEIAREVAKVLHGSGVLLSVKIRAGWDAQSLVAVELGQLLFDNGVDIVILHPRTRSQMYTGKSDWSLIKQLKQKTAKPVIGNGDIVTVEDALAMFESTGCDSVMIGRGALGRPWLFGMIRNYFLTKEKPAISFHHRYQIIEEHFALCAKYKGKERALKEMKTHIHHYTKGLKGGSKARDKINRCSDRQKMLEIIRDLYNE